VGELVLIKAFEKIEGLFYCRFWLASGFWRAGKVRIIGLYFLYFYITETK